MRPDEEGRALSQVAERLQASFPDVDSTTINQVVEQFHHTYDGRPIREFIPIMVEREARDHLHHLPRDLELPRQRQPGDTLDGQPEPLTQ